MARKKDLPCSGCGVLMWPDSRGPSAKKCRSCRSSAAPCGTYQGYRRGCRCEACRAANTAECAKYRTRTGYYATYDRPGRPRLDAKCLGCGESVRGAYRKDQPYHRACRERAEASQRRRDQAAARLARAAVGTAGASAWVTGECAQCFAYFVRRGAPSRFCSGACRRKARGSFKIALRDRLAIYERDAWTCQLCAEPVEPDLMATDPLNDWAPSLDHIEPQSWALIPDHSPSNLRLAHRWCNSVRGDLSHYNDSDLRVA